MLRARVARRRCRRSRILAVLLVASVLQKLALQEDVLICEAAASLLHQVLDTASLVDVRQTGHRLALVPLLALRNDWVHDWQRLHARLIAWKLDELRLGAKHEQVAVLDRARRQKSIVVESGQVCLIKGLGAR